MSNQYTAPWTVKEDDYLRKNYGLIEFDELSTNLKRTISSIKNRVVKIKVTRHQNNITEKCCSKCKIIKSIDNFRKRSDSRAVRRICKDCNKLKDKHYALKKSFGISLKEYNEMLEKQNNVCAICKKPEERKIRNKVCRLAVDHCHKTGNIRELLCGSCNSAIGQMKEDINILKNAINYLEKHNVR